MEERPFEFNGIPVKTPNAFKPNLATTSTPDSGYSRKIAENFELADDIAKNG